MVQPVFFAPPASTSLGELAALTGGSLAEESRADQPVLGIATLERASPRHLAFFDNRKYANRLAATKAGACLVSHKFDGPVAPGTVLLRVRDPYRAFVAVARHFHDNALRPHSSFAIAGIAASAIIHPTARLEDDVTIDPLAVIGPRAEIGSGTVIGSHAVIGENVRIGRDCNIGASASILFALIGNGVIVHPGCRIGQDGFGYTTGPRGAVKVPQLGRVIIQHDVEIGAGTTIDRGSLGDTVIGEGTKIDNLVQIGHNVNVGRHCIIVSQSGIGGSTMIGDGAVLGARVGVSDHATIGAGAMVAARSSVTGAIPANERWGGGFMAKPLREWARERLALEKLARGGAASATAGKDEA